MSRFRPEFSFDRAFTVSVPVLLFNGQKLHSGEPFPWRKLGVTQTQLWDLWLMNQVDNVPAEASASPAAPVAKPLPQQQQKRR